MGAPTPAATHQTRPRLPVRRPGRALLAVLAPLGLLVACSTTAGDGTGAGPAPGTGGAGPPTTDLVVYAAASLRDVAGPLADGFATQHPGVELRFDFDGSNALANRLAEGAPADVVALADEATMGRVAEAGRLDGDAHPFAVNRPALVVPAADPAAIGSVGDLGRPDVRLGLCAPTVPCGRVGRAALDQAGVRATPVTEETDVRSLLAKVTAGELDAGIVYRTDAIAAGDAVRVVPLPPAVDVATTYPIAVVTGSATPDLAAAFVAFVAGPDGRRIVATAGFEAP